MSDLDVLIQKCRDLGRRMDAEIERLRQENRDLVRQLGDCEDTIAELKAVIDRAHAWDDAPAAPDSDDDVLVEYLGGELLS